MNCSTDALQIGAAFVLVAFGVGMVLGGLWMALVNAHAQEQLAELTKGLMNVR